MKLHRIGIYYENISKMILGQVCWFYDVSILVELFNVLFSMEQPVTIEVTNNNLRE